MGRPVAGPTTYIVSRTADANFIIEAPTIFGAGTTPPLEQVIREATAEAHGGVPNDYAVIWNSDPAVLERLGRGDAHTVSWDGVDEENDAVYDFSNEENKRIVRCSVSKNNFEANNTDFVVVTCNVHVQNPDGSAGAIDATVNATRRIPVKSPLGRRYIEVTFVAGVATFNVRGNAAMANGDWAVPDPSIADNNNKIDEQSIVEFRGYVTAF